MEIDQAFLDLEVTSRLPNFAKLCETDRDTVVFASNCFGDTPDEFFLLAFAVKYALSRSKIVTILPKTANASEQSPQSPAGGKKV